MKYNTRKYPQFAVCGLNCGLCPNYHLHTAGKFQCPGCGGERFSEAHPSCGIISCCQRMGYELCGECAEFPCKKYDSWGDADSFITHRNIVTDMDKANKIGLEAYTAEQNERIEILSGLLKDFNDGRRKAFFCLAVNLLELQDIKTVVARIEREITSDSPLKEKAAAAVRLFEAMAQQRGVSLKKRKKAE